MMFKSILRKPAHKRTLGIKRQIPSMFTVVALTLGLIAAAPFSASANLPYELSRNGSDITITVDCSVGINPSIKHNINVYRGERITFTSKSGTTCTNITVRSSDAPATTVATGIFAAPWPSTFTNIMLQQAPHLGSYTATVLSNAATGLISKPIAVSNAGTKGASFQVTVIAPSPTVSSVSPSSAPIAGGTQITITGTSFAAGATVTVGGTACTSVTVVSPTSITCITPAGTVGAKNVVVRNTDGLTGTATGAITYRAISNPPSSNTTDFYADLNGTDTWMRTVGNQGPIPATGNFTLEFWVFDPSSREDTIATILAQAGADEDQRLEIQIDKIGMLDQELILVYRGQEYRTLFKLPQDTWAHITLLSNAGENAQNKIWLQVDGEQVFEVVTDAVVDSPPGRQILGPMFIGRAFADGSKQLFEGRVDQVKVWNGLLADAAIDRSMHLWGTQGVQTTRSLLAHYDFNDRTIAGGQLYNRAANSHPLVVTAASGTSPFVDVKQTIPTSGKTTFVFPRTYLTSLGGWRAPNGVVAIQEALVVGGGGAGAYDGAAGGGGGGSQFGAIPTVAPNQVLAVKVGQGGVPGNFTSNAFSPSVAGTNGQSSSISIAASEIATAAGGGRGPGALGNTTRGLGGTSSSFVNFQSSVGGAGGLGVIGGAPAEPGNAGQTLSSNFDKAYSFGGGGGGGIAGGANQPTSNITRASGGLGGGGFGASIGDILDGVHFCHGLTSGKGASAGGNAEPNTGGGGGGGAASGDACASTPNTRYDGERTAGGHGGSGVVIFGVASSVPVAPVPTFTVVAADNGTALTATWSNMTNAATTRKIVQYRVGNGSWSQVLDSSSATTFALPRTANGIVEFRVSQFDEPSEQWGEWVYSNQLNVTLYVGELCVNPLKLRYDIPSPQTIVLSFTNSLTPSGITIRWGDGTGVATFTAAGGPASRSKSFTNPGTYTIEVCGKFQRFTTNGLNLVEIVQWGEWVDNDGLTTPPPRSLSLNETNIDRSFSYPTRLRDVPATFPSTVNSAVALFQGATILNDPDIANWDMSNVTAMAFMFGNADAFNQNISAWNVTNVTSMAFMFYFARSFNQDISAWNTINVTNFSQMLSYASSYTHKPPIKIDKATNASKMLDYSGISDVTYSQTIIDWAERIAPTTRPAVLALGAIDKTALCTVSTVVNEDNLTAVDRLLSLVAGGWTVTDKTNRLAGHCDTTITITATSTSQVYGDPVPSVAFTPVISGPRSADPTWVDQVTCSAKVSDGGAAVLATTAPGPYVTECSGPTSAGTGFNVVYVRGTHTITKKPLAITVKNRTERKGSTWSTATTSLSNSSDLTEYSITNGSLVGADELSVTITKGAPTVGTQFTLGGALAAAGAHARYEATFTPGVLTISDKTYVITADNRTRIYGEALSPVLGSGWTCQAATTGAALNDAACKTDLATRTVTLASTGTDLLADAGTYPITSSVAGSYTEADYEIVNSNGGSITVTKRPLYVTPTALTVNAGSSIPTYTFALSNWANSLDGENMVGFTAPSCTSGYTLDTPRGSNLAITCSGGNAGSNYYFVYETATLTVPGYSEFEDLTPAMLSTNPTTGAVQVPFEFNVNPVLDVCYATLRVTYLSGAVEQIDPQNPTNVIESRVLVESPNVQFNLELFEGEYEYELEMDGNCAIESAPKALTVAAGSSQGGGQGSPGSSASLVPSPGKISPFNAPPNKRTAVEITGANLADVAQVKIGNKTVKKVVASDGSLKFKLPKLKPGKYDILLVMSDGTTLRWEKAVRITGKIVGKTKSKTFASFAAGSYKLTPSMKKAIRGYLQSQKAAFSSIECVGYTDGPLVRRVDVPLSINRARVACDFAKKLGYTVISRSFVNERTPGAELRRVKLILGK